MMEKDAFQFIGPSLSRSLSLPLLSLFPSLAISPTYYIYIYIFLFPFFFPCPFSFSSPGQSSESQRAQHKLLIPFRADTT